MLDIRTISPFKCRVWDLHDRVGEDIDVNSCKSLLESIKRHGQKQPVLGRLVPDDPEYRVELIYGARRLFVTRHLAMRLVVQICDIDDRAALIEMDAENRVRADITPYERGLSYRRWLRAGHFSSQSDIAKAVGVSEAQISRLLKYSDLPAAVVAAFESPRDIREEWAVALAKRCCQGKFKVGMIQRARSCRNLSQTTPQRVYDILINDGKQKIVEQKPRDEVVKSKNGNVVMRVAFRTRSVHFIIPREQMTRTRLEDLKRLVADYFGESQGSPRAELRLVNVGNTNHVESRLSQANANPA